MLIDHSDIKIRNIFLTRYTNYDQLTGKPFSLSKLQLVLPSESKIQPRTEKNKNIPDYAAIFDLQPKHKNSRQFKEWIGEDPYW